ncbi:hypothetical protein Barb7_02098 [Bacteroidales bacterium Barb7]|nr:hypothetical protein Barb7_02098 [Bacteroidales bacterium Barb7]
MEDDKVNQFRFPIYFVVLNGYTVIPQDVNLFRYFLATQHAGLDFIHLVYPYGGDVVGDVLLKFGVFEVLGVAVDRIDGRVAFAVGTVLFQCVEATGYLLGVLRYGLFQVTAGGRYGADEGDRAG